MRSTMDLRLGERRSLGRSSSERVAETAPQREWPRTTTSGVPKLAAANSTLPIWEGATMLPATRMTKRSPMPWSKTISAGTRESEQPRMMAKGCCAAATSARRLPQERDSPERLSAAKWRLPSMRRWSAPAGVGMELGMGRF